MQHLIPLNIELDEHIDERLKMLGMSAKFVIAGTWEVGAGVIRSCGQFVLYSLYSVF